MKLYETERFYLRPFVKEDITNAYLAWFADQIVTKHTSHGLIRYTHEMAIEFLENAEKNGDVVWAIIIPENIGRTYTSKEVYEEGKIIKKHIGNIALQNISQVNKNAEFAGILGGKEYWGKGIGTEAIKILFEHGFNKLNLNRIWLGTAETNKGMITIALKLGMVLEGRLKNHVFLNGEYVDIMQFGIMRNEWNQK